jgi:hypothetical protein
MTIYEKEKILLDLEIVGLTQEHVLSSGDLYTCVFCICHHPWCGDSFIVYLCIHAREAIIVP